MNTPTPIQSNAATPPAYITLTDEQQAAVTAILHWFDNEPLSREFKLGGFAGTGKTTILKHLIHELETRKQPTHIAVMAFTGKAASVLRSKGVRSACTIHSTIYQANTHTHPVTFSLRHKNDDQIYHLNLFIIDEASMVSTELYNDLKTFNKKILFVGDPGQLEPVGKNPNLMGKPNLVLKKIHRQAENSDIIQLSCDIRQGFPVMVRKPKDGAVCIKKKSLLSEEAIASHSQSICARNTTRQFWNANMRRHFKRDGIIAVGEKLICLKNDPEIGMFNGLMFTVSEIVHVVDGCITVNAIEEGTNRVHHKLKLWTRGITEPKLNPMTVKEDRCPKGWAQVDYGYVITCHKSQGSEWESVLVIDEPMPAHVWDMKRWRYTAVTRASKFLTYFI